MKIKKYIVGIAFGALFSSFYSCDVLDVAPTDSFTGVTMTRILSLC